MEYVYAALLLHSAKQPITEENVKKILQSAGLNVNEARVQALVAALSEVNIDEAIKSAPGLAVAPAPTPAATPEPKKKAEEKKKEKEEAIAGLGALFG